MTLRLGVLAIQGDAAENVSSLRDSAAELGEDASVRAVKSPGEVSGLDGLVIPGGESTAIGQLSLTNGSLARIKQRAESGMPVLGICAGMVLLASRASDPAAAAGVTGQPLLGILDIEIERNSFGRQRQSFEADVSMEAIGIPSFRGVFIRSPAVASAPSGAEPLALLDKKIVAVRKGNVVGTSFHPELTGDLAVHKYFVGLARESKRRSGEAGARLPAS